jgi:hypothetical protein
MQVLMLMLQEIKTKTKITFSGRHDIMQDRDRMSEAINI